MAHKSKIFKYRFKATDINMTNAEVELPFSAVILKIGVQGGALHLWARVRTMCGKENTRVRKFKIYGTGHLIEDYQNKKYIDTVFSGPYVWHIYEV